MKKTFNIFFAAVALATLTLTGCIKEVFPQDDIATLEQIGASASALEASVNGIPSQMAQGYLIYGDQVYEYDMAFPALMINFSEALGDFYPLYNAGYDHYQNWGRCTSMGEDYAPTYVVWRTLYMFIKSANDVIAAVDLDDEDLSDTMRGYAGIGYACRAFDYYWLMTLYEPVKNDYVDCSKVLGLTIPIVTADTDSKLAADNDRVSHDEMVEFILSDCDMAEQCLADYTPTSRLFPSLAVVYAIKARTYMWDEDYANAATYARKAIDASGAPMTENEWLNENTAFNTATDGWLWYIHYDAENMGNLCNFIGWVSPESDWGYASLTGPGIDRALYDYIPATDFRKHAFVDPDRSYYNYVTVRTDDFLDYCPDYTALKFRCVGGDWENYTTGAAADVPVIRVEEMYYIEAEAIGRSQGVGAGVSALNSFVQTYRDPSYNFSCSTADELANEIFQQMRVEFWGEGTAFQTAKRIRPGVMKNYTGTNCPTDALKVNSREIQGNWNLVIPRSELDANPGISTNNPDPSECVVGPSPIDEYAEPGYVPGSDD
ncbi:MAG: RagB/SusD family nutrient uptake outer membrane protein [Bacteroidales bacterium]|nr:RagB/SusD family nutrient uptake outer membrane protein [Bacteroidales bacterium]